MGAETLLLMERPGPTQQESHAQNTHTPAEGCPYHLLCRPSLLLLTLPQQPLRKDSPGPRLPVEERSVRRPREQPGLCGSPQPTFCSPMGLTVQKAKQQHEGSQSWTK